jgi:hypothetical protein
MPSEREWDCKQCGRKVVSFGGRDIDCECGACYNGFGQRLRSDWRSNLSCYNSEIGDMEGYEIAALRRDAELEGYTNG